MLQSPDERRRRERHRALGRRVLPWLALVAAVGALATVLGVPWWISGAAGLVVLAWIVFEP
jgi:hypothetical protein